MEQIFLLIKIIKSNLFFGVLNIKEIIYNSAEKYAENYAFVIKHKLDKEATFTNITYQQLLKDINYLGTAFYSLNLKNSNTINNEYFNIFEKLKTMTKNQSFITPRINSIILDRLKKSFNSDK